jgi:transcription initiation factor TFIID subunit 7
MMYGSSLKVSALLLYMTLSHSFVLFMTLDSRRAVFHVGNSLYSAKLVDLPCILESQKTLDNKQMFKVADICQVAMALHR